MKPKQILAAVLSLSLAAACPGNTAAAEVEEDNTTAAVTDESESEYTHISETVSVYDGDCIETYLYIRPYSAIELNSSIILTFENAVVSDNPQPAYNDSQYTKSYDTLLQNYIAAGGDEAAAKNVLDNVFSSSIEDVYMPWYMTKTGSTRIEADLFPVPEEYCNNYYTSYGHNNIPYYYLPLKIYANGAEGETVSVTVDSNGTAVSGGTFEIGVITGDNTDYELEFDSSTGTVTGCTGRPADVVIPDEIDGVAVTSIGDSAFSGCTRLTGITIPSTVTSIGSYAFQQCAALNNITIPDTVTSIGSYAFYDCPGLESITIPNSITSIEENLFCGCISLKNVIIPDSVTSISSYAFCDCPGLESISIPNSVTSIGGYIFYYCTSLKNITLPDSITNISNSMFWGCSDLETITIPDGVTSIDDCAFSICTSLSNVTIPSSVTSIGNFAFSACTSLSSITIPNDVTSIGNNTFYNCTSLGSITIPDSVTSIGDYAFYNCTSLGSIAIPDNVTSIGKYAFYKCTSLSDIAISDNLTSISNYTFYNCTSLGSITIPDSVTSIGDYAFRSCTSLSSITIPNSVTSIGVCTFYNCTSLSSITIPDSVTSIGDYAFYNCTSLSSITIPSSVTSIGSSTFTYSGLTEVYCYKGSIAVNSSLYPDETVLIYLDDTGESKIIVDAESCGENAAYILFSDGSLIIYGTGPMTNYTSLRTPWYSEKDNILCIEIENGITSIGEWAFYGCTNFSSITISDSVTSIGDYAFYGCTNLSSITIPDSVTSVGIWAFSDCTSLTGITISNNITSIDNYAFYGCTSLSSITIPDSVTSIGCDAFCDCTSLSSITIPDSVISIDSFAFSWCESLSSITIPDSVTSIGDYAFCCCTNLSSITIPDSVTAINKSVFSNSGLTKVYCYEGSAADDSSLYPDGVTIYYLSDSSDVTETTTEAITETTTETASSAAGMGTYAETQFITAGDWQAATFGNSCNADNIYVEGENAYKNWAAADDDSTVTLHAEKGKIGDGSATANSEGIVFYYQPVAADKDFTVSATATVNYYTHNNQVAFGLQMRDQIFDNMTNPSQNLGASIAAGGFRLGNGTLDASGYYYNDNGVYVSANKSASYPTDSYLFIGSGEELCAGDSIDITLSYNASSDMITYTVGDISQSFAVSDLGSTLTFSDEIYVGAFVARETDVTFSNLKLTVEEDEEEAESPYSFVVDRDLDVSDTFAAGDSVCSNEYITYSAVQRLSVDEGTEAGKFGSYSYTNSLVCSSSTSSITLDGTLKSRKIHSSVTAAQDCVVTIATTVPSGKEIAAAQKNSDGTYTSLAYYDGSSFSGNTEIVLRLTAGQTVYIMGQATNPLVYAVDAVPVGDADGNHIPELTDSAEILKYIEGSASLSAAGLKAADVNSDGIIDEKDAALVLKQIISAAG